MNKIRLIIFILFSFQLVILGQKSTKISGNVTDSNDSPLPGANIFITTLNFGAAADANGKYVFFVPADQSNGQTVEMTARYIGYKPQTISITLSGSNIEKKFTLKKDIFKSEEVVVTGIASKTAKSIAEVSVSRINTSELTNTSTFQTMSQLVEGKISGVHVSSSSGNTGGGYRFYVRGGGGLNGDEQPTIYIDGVRVDNDELHGWNVGGQAPSALSTLDPEDIAKIEVLKGPAAAATYGTSGSNGVVLITTKSGTYGRGITPPFSVNYKFAYGLNTQSYKYKTSDFITANDANAIFRDGIIRQNTLNVSGGSNLLRYYVSFDDRSEQGNILNNGLNRRALRANLTSYSTSDLTLKASLGYSLTDINRPRNDYNIIGFLHEVLTTPEPYQNVDSSTIAGSTDKNFIRSFTGGVQINYTPANKLELSFKGGLDNNNYKDDQLISTNTSYNGLKKIDNQENIQYSYDFNARYSYNIITGLKATSVVGVQLFDRTFKESGVSSFDFITNLITEVGAGSQIYYYGEDFLNSREAGIFTEHNLSYNNQYFLTLGLREDYSSSIGTEAPTILYPKASIAIRLDKYNWFSSGFFNLFKIRAAYGENGQLPDPRASIPFLWGAISGGYGAGAVITNIGNSSIEPERIKEIETGFEAEFLEDYSIEFTYYQQNASNSIVYISKSPSTGLTASAVPFNIGGMKNWGFEVLLKASLIRSRDYGLALSLIWNYQKNEVTNLGGAEPIYDYAFDVNTIKQGLPKHEFYTWKSIGAKFDSAGKYAGSIVTESRVDLGNPIPNHTGSFSINFRFLKNFNLYGLATWVLNRKMLNVTKQFAAQLGNVPEYNKLAAQLDQITDHPEISRLAPGSQDYIDAANQFAKMDYNYHGNYIENAQYCKINELSLSYSLQDLLFQTGYNYINDITVGISALNLWTLTNYSGADPEINWSGSRSLSRGQDFLTLQHPRVYNFWVRINLL
jgi:TonB-dependent starch-binding outer membrane protein SusC